MTPRICRTAEGALTRGLMLPIMLWCLIGTAPARAESSFSLAALGNGVYSINGAGLASIAALDFTVNYDPATLSAPRVAKGAFVPADAIFFANTSITGEVRIMLIRSRELAGSGTLATVAFQRIGSAEPRILGFRSNPVSISAAPLDARARTVSALETPPEVPHETPPGDPATGEPPAEEPHAVPAPPAAEMPIGSAVPAGGDSRQGEVVLQPKVEQPVPETPPAGDGIDRPAGEAAEGAGPAAAAEPPSVSEPEQPPLRPREIKIITERFASILDRFRDFRGERSAAALLALFSDRPRTVSQEPGIALSDGSTPVVIRVAVADEGGTYPMFTLEKARLIEFQFDDRGWTLTILPEKGAIQARVSVTSETARIEYALVVAPPLDAAIAGFSIDEAGLGRYLAVQGEDKSARLDLNGDDQYSYIDDYIFAANVLAAGRQGK